MGRLGANLRIEDLDEERVELRIRIAMLDGALHNHAVIDQLRTRVGQLDRQIAALRGRR